MSGAIHRLPDPSAAAAACGARILQLLPGGSSSLALSGGSTPKLLFQQLSRAGHDWSQVHIFWVDDRAVPPGDEQSNYRLAREHLLDAVHIPARNIHRIRTELEPAAAAQHYSDEIRAFFALEKGELPRFDVVHLGMGSDGHTASLFPGEPLIHDRRGIAAAVYVEKIPQWRITLLPGVLLAASNVVFLAPGEDKAQPLQAILNGPEDADQLPAQLIARHAQRVEWFLDHPAARLV